MLKWCGKKKKKHGPWDVFFPSSSGSSATSSGNSSSLPSKNAFCEWTALSWNMFKHFWHMLEVLNMPFPWQMLCDTAFADNYNWSPKRGLYLPQMAWPNNSVVPCLSPRDPGALDAFISTPLAPHLFRSSQSPPHEVGAHSIGGRQEEKPQVWVRNRVNIRKSFGIVLKADHTI